MDQPAPDAVRGAVTAILLFLAVFLSLILYFVPTMIALYRRHHNTVPIVALNVVLGCTFVGWFVAFVWALTSPSPPTVVIVDRGRRRRDDDDE